MTIDIIAALFIAFGFYIGFSRGLVKTVFASLSIVVGILAALKLSPIVINFLQSAFNINPAALFLIGLVLTFLLVLFLIRFIGRKIEDILQTTHLNILNKLSGAAVMTFLFAVVLSYGLYFMAETNLLNASTKKNSIAYNNLKGLPQASKELAHKTKPIFKGFWDKLNETMDQIRDKAGTDEIKLDQF